MIAKIKIGAAVAVFVLFAAILGLYLKERRANRLIRQEHERTVSLMSLNLLKDRLERSPAAESKYLKPRKHDANGNPLELPGRELEDQKTCCQKCFENFEYDLEVKDQDGRWVFKDSNVFDQEPGRLTLTDRFWEEIRAENIPSAYPDQKPAASPKRLKSRVLVGLEIDRARIEYAYSPLGVRTDKFEIGLAIYSSLSLNYSWLPISAAAGVGVEARF